MINDFFLSNNICLLFYISIEINFLNFNDNATQYEIHPEFM